MNASFAFLTLIVLGIVSVATAQKPRPKPEKEEKEIRPVIAYPGLELASAVISYADWVVAVTTATTRHTERLYSRNKYIVSDAENNLIEIGGQYPQIVVPILLGELTTEAICWQVSSVLGRIGHQHPDSVLSELFRRLSNPESARLYMVSANALTYLGRDASSAVPVLMSRLNDSRIGVRYYSALALGAIGEDARSAVPALIQRLSSDSDRSVRVASIRALRAVGKEARAAVNELRIVMRADQDGFVRTDAAEALAAIGEEARDAVPELIVGVSSRVSQLSIASAEALAAIGKEARAAIPALRSGISEDLFLDPRTPLRNSFISGLVSRMKKAFAVAISKIATEPGDYQGLVEAASVLLAEFSHERYEPEKREMAAALGRIRTVLLQALDENNDRRLLEPIQAEQDALVTLVAQRLAPVFLTVQNGDPSNEIRTQTRRGYYNAMARSFLVSTLNDHEFENRLSSFVRGAPGAVGPRVESYYAQIEGRLIGTPRDRGGLGPTFRHFLNANGVIPGRIQIAAVMPAPFIDFRRDFTFTELRRRYEGLETLLLNANHVRQVIRNSVQDINDKEPELTRLLRNN